MLTGLGHIAFRVTDLEKARDFYCNKLGLREVFRLERKHDHRTGSFISRLPRSLHRTTPQYQYASKGNLF